MSAHSWIYAWNHPALENWLRHFAIDTWDRIAFCRKDERNRVFETTITQNMVYEFFKIQVANAFPVQIEESKNEKVNGNDLEIIIKANQKYLIFPAQCKIVDKQGKYSTINHSSSIGLQIESLLSYGSKINGTPIYLLYNHWEDGHINSIISAKWNHIPIEAIGCSFIDAWYIFESYVDKNLPNENKWVIPTFNELHTSKRAALPFEFLSNFIYLDFMEEYKKHYSEHFYFKTEFPHHLYHLSINKDSWRSFSGPASIGRINPQSSQQENYYSNESSLEFAPAYRIIFDLDLLNF